MTPTTEVLDFENEDYSLDREKKCIRLALEANLEIFSRDDHTLVFDLDSEEAYSIFMERVHFLENKFVMQTLIISKSKSGNWHAVATIHPTFPPIDPVVALVIQACLGSDWKKEMLGALRTIHYKAPDSKLFRPKTLEVVYEWHSTTEGYGI